MEMDAPRLDSGDAGVFWRACRRQSLEASASLLAASASTELAEELQSMLRLIKAATSELDELWESQRRAPDKTRWWQDGELDRNEAESMNERGVVLLAKGDLTAAFSAFTEAVRLWPAAAAYHSNRAAAAIALGRFADAEESAAEAARRDGTSHRALLRLGRARLELGKYQEAREAFTAACKLTGPGSKGRATAEAGLRSVVDLCAAEDRRRATGAASGDVLSRAVRPCGDAAADLEAARVVMARQPGVYAARAAAAAAYIDLGRWHDAEEVLEGLPEDGEECGYLAAEIAWRRGDVSGAVRRLRSQAKSAIPAGRQARLLGFLEPLEKEIAAVEAGEDHGGSDSEDRAFVLLTRLERDAPAARGLLAELRVCRGRRRAARGAAADALSDARAALELEPGLAPALHLQATALSALGRHTDAFLAWRQLAKAAPGWPGLERDTAAAARRCASHQAVGARAAGCNPGSAGGIPATSVPTAALEALGLRTDSGALITHGAVRAAYRREAGRCHPDRWAGGTTSEIRDAEARFIELRAAHDLVLEYLGAEPL